METLLTGTDQDGYFSCRGLAGLYLLGVLPCQPPNIVDHTIIPAPEPIADAGDGAAKEEVNALSHALADAAASAAGLGDQTHAAAHSDDQPSAAPEAGVPSVLPAQGTEGSDSRADALVHAVPSSGSGGGSGAGDGSVVRAPMLRRGGQRMNGVKESSVVGVQVSMLALARSSSWEDEIEKVQSVSAHWQGADAVVSEANEALALVVWRVKYRRALEMLQMQQGMQREKMAATAADAGEKRAQASGEAAAAQRELEEAQASGGGEVDAREVQVAQTQKKLQVAEENLAQALEAADALAQEAAQAQAELDLLRLSTRRDLMPDQVCMSSGRMRTLTTKVMQKLSHSFSQMLPDIAPWGGGEDGGWAELSSAERDASAAYVKAAELEQQSAAEAQEALAAAAAATAATSAAAAELKEAKSMAAGNIAELAQAHASNKGVSDEAAKRAALASEAAESAKVAAKDAALKAAELEAAVEAGERKRTSRWSTRRVLLPPGGRLGLRLLVCPALEPQQSIVALSWNPAYQVLLRMVVLTPWGHRTTYLQPQSISSEPFSTNLLGSPTQPNGKFLVSEQPRALMGFDDATDGGPVLCACWGHASSGNFKIAVTMATKGPTKEEQEAAKACATASRHTFYKAVQFNNAAVERALGGGKGDAKKKQDSGKAPNSVQDPRLQIQLRVFSNSGGVQLFCPERDGFFRSGEWNGCLLSSEMQKALPFLDGNEHMAKIETLLNANDVTGAWKEWKSFKRSGTGLDEDIQKLRTMVFATQTRLIACADESLKEAADLQKQGKIFEARAAWMSSQEHLTNAGVIAEKTVFDNFSNVRGRVLPADDDVQDEQEVLIDRSIALKYADSLAQTHKGVKNSEVVMRVLRRMNMKLLNFCWEHWCEVVAYQQKLRESARRVLKRMTNMKLALAFETWVHEWTVQKKSEELLKRIMGHCLDDHLVEWMHTVQEQLAGRRVERARLDQAYAGAETALLIAAGLRERKMLHDTERKCYGYLLTIKWEADDMVSSVASPAPGRAFVGFDAETAEDVDWDAFTARHAERHKLRPSVFPRLASQMKEEATHFLGKVKPLRDDCSVDVPGVLRWVLKARQLLREAAFSSMPDVAIVSLVASRKGHVEEMAEKCRRLAVSAVEVLRRAQWLGESALIKAEEYMLDLRVPPALMQLVEAEKRLRQASAMSKRPAILSVKVRALGALKLFRAIARRAQAAGARGDDTAWSQLADQRFQGEITFARLLDDMKTQMENLRSEVAALARSALLSAQRYLEGGGAGGEVAEGADAFSGGDYPAARASLVLCREYCEKLEELDLELDARQQMTARIDEAEAALARGDKRLEEGWAAQEEGALIEARDLLRAAGHEFEAAYAVLRRTQQVHAYEEGLQALESTVYERGLEQLREAVIQLKEKGDPAAARECIAAADQVGVGGGVLVCVP